MKILDAYSTIWKKTVWQKIPVVIYSSDQGWYLGEHGWYDKRWMYEESFRTTLIVRWPGVTKSGSKNADLVQNLDYAQTFLDICGVKSPKDMQEPSQLCPFLKEKKTKGLEKVFILSVL